MTNIMTDTLATNPDTRYPYTYACDFIRLLAGRFDADGEVLSGRFETEGLMSPAQASKIVVGIALALGVPADEFARNLVEKDQQYPHTYITNLIRDIAGVQAYRDPLSRSQASQIRQGIALAISMEDDALARKLADYWLAHEDDIFDLTRQSVKSFVSKMELEWLAGAYQPTNQPVTPRPR